MKKLLVLALAAMMLLGLSSFAMASNIFLDYGINHKISAGGDDYDLKDSFVAGVSAPIDNWYVGLDYYSTKAKDVNDSFNNTTLRGGYSFINDDTTRVTGTLSILNSEDKYSETGFSDTYKIENVFAIGLDTDFKVADNMTFGFGFDYAIANKKYKEEVSILGVSASQKFDLDSILNYKLHFNYFFTDTVGASLGYFCDSIKYDKNADTGSFHGFTVGVNFKF